MEDHQNNQEETPDVGGVDEKLTKEILTDYEEVNEKPSRTLAENEVSLETLDKTGSSTDDDDVEFDTKFMSPVMLSCSVNEAAQYITYLKDTLSDADFVDQIADPNSLITGLRKIVSSASTADKFNRDRLKKINPNDLKRKYIKEDIRLTDATPVSNNDFKGKVVSGKEAQLLMLAKNKNILRIFLYNSGFDITLRGPTLAEINNYYNKISAESDEYGREYGVHFFMFSDIIIKRATIELVESLITHASLKNWGRGQNILRGISLLDYDVLLWAIGTLMYRKGFPFQFVCSNPKHTCGYTETKEIDLRKLRLNNYSIITDEAIKMIANSEVKSFKDVAAYQKALGLSRLIPLYSNYVAKTKVPSLYEYLEYGTAFNAALWDQIQTDNKEQLYRYLEFNYYKVFAPWIEEIRYVEDDGSINFRVQDSSAITTALDTTQLEETAFGDDMKNFISDSMITHICIPFDKCPNCNYVPKYVINDAYIAFDVQQNFFTQSVMRMTQVS